MRHLIVGLALLLATAGCSSSPAPGDLGEAVATEDVAAVADLLGQGVDPDQPVVDGLTPLMRAAIRGQDVIAQMLIDGGADVDATDLAGLTPLHHAAGADKVPIIEILLRGGADATTTSAGGMNALDHAALSGSSDAIEYLVSSAGLDPDSPSEVITQGHGSPRDRGPTPLAIAVRAGMTESVETLLELGADVNGSSTAGQTPLLTAVFSDQSPEMVGLLLTSGADVSVTAECDEACSVTGILTATEWAEELERTELLDVLRASR